MDEKFLLQVLNSSDSSILTLDKDFNVTFFNSSLCEQFSKFGIGKEVFTNAKNPFFFSKTFFENNKESFSNGGSLAINRLKLAGEEFEVDANVNPLLKDNEILGLNLTINKVKRMITEDAPKRRTHKVIRNLILNTLCSKRKTINQVAKDVDVNWRTVESHLTYLVGKKYVKEVFCSEYVRIFDITEEGKIKLGIEKHKARKEAEVSKKSNLHSTSRKQENITNKDDLSIHDYELSQEVEK